MRRIYVCNDTITGLYSAIYDAWKSCVRDIDASIEVCGIAFRGKVEQQLFCEYEEVEESNQKAQAVENLIKKNLGVDAYQFLYQAALSEDIGKGDAILGTMLEARKLANPSRVTEHLSHPQVEKAFELCRNVGGEAHSFKGFLRFQELQGDILYAEFRPKNQILTCIAPHFADRLPKENWMICDKTHHMYAVHEAGKQWVLVWDENLQIDAESMCTQNEKEYQRLWKNFCRTIAIESRTNPQCQLTHLPLRYRPDMTEFSS